MELLEALKTIRRECRNHKHCDDCSMRSGDETLCMITVLPPSMWAFAGENDTPKRLFE